MRGHLEQRGPTSWRAKVYIGRDPQTGVRRYVTKTVHGTKRHAESVMNELLVEAASGAIGVDEGTFTELANRWLDLSRDTLSPTTAREYERILIKHVLPRFGDVRVHKITSADLDAFYAHLRRRGGDQGRPLSALSVQHVHAIVRRLFNQAVKWSWIARNPAHTASPPKVPRRDLELPTPDAVVRIIEVATARDPNLGLFLRLSAVTGARRGEVCAIRWDDICDATLRISRSIVDTGACGPIEKDTKTHAIRRVTLDDATLSLLADARTRAADLAQRCGGTLPPHGYIFSDQPDRAIPWRPNRVTLAFGRLCKQLDLGPVRLHDLRHFAATQLLAAGVPVKTVAGRLGHANAATTLNVYAHALEASDAAAAGVIGGLLDPTQSAVRRASGKSPLHA